MIYHHETKQSRGFGFVQFGAEDTHAAKDAIDEMDQSSHDGRAWAFALRSRGVLFVV